MLYESLLFAHRGLATYRCSRSDLKPAVNRELSFVSPFVCSMASCSSASAVLRNFLLPLLCHLCLVSVWPSLCRVFVSVLALSLSLSLSSLLFSSLALPCLVLSCLVVSCLVLSCLVLSCLVLSCRVVSRLVLSCRAVSCRGMSCHVL